MKSSLRWKKVCVPFLLVLLLAVLPGLALAETAPQALAALPPLPKAATKDLDCSLGEKMGKKVNEVAQRAAGTAQAGMGSGAMPSMTPAQMQAMQAMTEPAYNSCPVEVMQPAQGWSQEPDQKLEARLAEIDAAKLQADQAWCETHSTGEMCMPNPAAIPKFNAQAVAAGTQYLKDAQAGYGKLVKLAADCLALRDPPVNAARGLQGPFAGMAAGADSQNWALVGLIAEAHSKACTTARDAASKYLPQP